MRDASSGTGSTSPAAQAYLKAFEMEVVQGEGSINALMRTDGANRMAANMTHHAKARGMSDSLATLLRTNQVRLSASSISDFSGRMKGFSERDAQKLMAHFLSSQLDYVNGLLCGVMEIHFVCTETFDRDLGELLKVFGMSAIWPQKRRNFRSKGHADVLSDADKQFVRECLYPWDAKLHDLVCGPDGLHAQRHDVRHPESRQRGGQHRDRLKVRI